MKSRTRHSRRILLPSADSFHSSTSFSISPICCEFSAGTPPSQGRQRLCASSLVVVMSSSSSRVGRLLPKHNQENHCPAYFVPDRNIFPISTRPPNEKQGDHDPLGSGGPGVVAPRRGSGYCGAQQGAGDIQLHLHMQVPQG